MQIAQPQQNLQFKVVRELPNTNQFVAYIGAIGELDGHRCLMDWKTTSSRYPEAPAELLSLDPQLICYSWMTGISEVALVVFVRKNQPEIQYLKTSISQEQRVEFCQLIETTICKIESAQFPSHSGIRFPQNGCVSCSHLGLCLHNQELIDSTLIRIPGAYDLAWLDELIFAACQHNFAQSSFDYGKPAEFSGTLALQPFPILAIDDHASPTKKAEPPYLLVAPGKFGADSLVAGKEGKHVRLRGTLSHRAEGQMIELEPGSITETANSQVAARVEKDLGFASLNGEIVDTKCFLGVMKPGEGKLHRDCASRCLSGGIPPALVTTDLDGLQRLVLITAENGKPLPKAEFMTRVGQPVSIRGRVVESQGLYYVHANAADIVPLR